MVLDKFDIKQPKTKEFKKLTEKLKADSALIVNDKFDENLFLSSRNIKYGIFRCELNQSSILLI